MAQDKYHLQTANTFSCYALCGAKVSLHKLVNEATFIRLDLRMCCKECESIRRVELERKVGIWAGRIK